MLVSEQTAPDDEHNKLRVSGGEQCPVVDVGETATDSRPDSPGALLTAIGDVEDVFHKASGFAKRFDVRMY